MAKQDTLACIKESGLIGIIRSESSAGLVEAAHALYKAGVRAVEISLTTPGTLETVKNIRQDLPEGCLIGVGTVMQAETLAATRLDGSDGTPLTSATGSLRHFAHSPMPSISMVLLAGSRTSCPSSWSWFRPSS